MKKRKMSLLVSGIVSCLLVLTFLPLAVAADGAKYPSRTVEVVNQFGPGGGTDLFVRAIAMPFAKITKQSLVPISVTGGGGVPAATDFFDRPADGHSMMAIGPEEVINHAMKRIDAKRFIPLARIQYDQGMFYVRAKSPYKTINDVIAAAKKSPGKLSIAVTGAAGFDDVLVGLWNLKSKAELKSVPFEAAAEATAAVLGGHVDLLYEEYGPMRALIESGKLRPLVSFTETRLPVVKDVPTAKELGVDVTLGRWRGFAFKEGTKPEQVEAMSKILAKAAVDPVYKAVEEQNMLQFRSKYLGPAEFKPFFEKEMEVYAEVMKKLGYTK
jgi:putative tricarboxylic transport membrane protein